DPRSATRMIVGSDQGAAITLDGGRTWSSWFNQPTAQFYHVVTDDAFPYRVYGAQQDAGTGGVASRSDFGEITFRDWAPVGAGEWGPLGRLGRRLDAPHHRWRRALAECDASGPAALEHRQFARGLAVRYGGGVRRRGPAPGRRLRSLHLSHARRRRALDP